MEGYIKFGKKGNERDRGDNFIVFFLIFIVKSSFISINDLLNLMMNQDLFLKL